MGFYQVQPPVAYSFAETPVAHDPSAARQALQLMAAGDYRAAKALIQGYHVHPAELPTGAALDRLMGPASRADTAALEFRRFLASYSTQFRSNLAASRYPGATRFIQNEKMRLPPDTSIYQSEGLRPRPQIPVRTHVITHEQARYIHTQQNDSSRRAAPPQPFRMPTLPIWWGGEQIRAEDQFNGRADRRDVQKVFEHLLNDRVDKAFSIWNEKNLPGELMYREVSLQNVLRTMNTASPAMVQMFHQCARERAINDAVLKPEVARRVVTDAGVQVPSPYPTRSKPPAVSTPMAPVVAQTQSLPAVARQKSEPPRDVTRHTRHDAMREAAAGRNESWRLPPVPEPTRSRKAFTTAFAQFARVWQYTFVKSARSPEEIEQQRRARLQAGGTASRL